MAIKEKVNVLGLPERVEGVAGFESEFARVLGLIESDPEVRARANLMADRSSTSSGLTSMRTSRPAWMA